MSGGCKLSIYCSNTRERVNGRAESLVQKLASHSGSALPDRSQRDGRMDACSFETLLMFRFAPCHHSCDFHRLRKRGISSGIQTWLWTLLRIAAYSTEKNSGTYGRSLVTIPSIWP